MVRRTIRALALLCAECALFGQVLAAGGGPLDLQAHFSQFQRTATQQFTGYLDIPDATGTRWDFDARGAINDGLNDCYDGGMILTVNGMQFSSQQGAIGPDSDVMLYADMGGGLRLCRYLHVDVASGTCLYVDSVENVTNQPTRVALALYSDHGTQQMTYVSNLGAATPVQLSKGEGGLHTVHHPGRTSVIYALCSPRSKVKPTLMWQNLEYPTFTYELEIPPGKTCSVMCLLQQRVSTGTIPTADQLEDAFEPLFDRQWLRSLPADLRRTIVNWGGTGGDLGAASAGALLQPVLDLAESFGLEIGGSARLVLSEDAALTGQVSGGLLQVRSACGPVEVAWEEVALLVGGAGQGRPMRVYLKNGETYCGDIAAPDFRFQTDSGLEIALEPAQMNYLFAPLLPGDGLPPAAATLLVELRSGDRLFVAPSEARLTCYTAWGPVELAVGDIRDLVYTRDPQPGYSVQLQDYSRVHALLADAPLVLAPLRIASLETSVQQVVRLTSVRAFQASSEEEPANAVVQSSYFELAGGMVLVGGFAAAPLELQTASGTTPLDPAHVASVEVAEPARLGSGPLLQFTLRDGGTLTGRLNGRMLEIAAGERSWRVPLEYLLAYRTPEPAQPEDESEDPSAGQPAEDQRPIENRLDESYEFFEEGPDGAALPADAPADAAPDNGPPTFDSPFEEPAPEEAEQVLGGADVETAPAP